MVIRPLSPEDFDALHRAFIEAFSDYVVPLAPPADRLREMLTRRGYVPSASVCAIEDDRIVAFTLNAVDGDHGYDSGTGVIPSHRKLRLGRQMMEHSFELLRAHGCRDYTLEVIDSNTPAANLYRGLGFRETRGLQCWTYDGEARSGGPRAGRPAAGAPNEHWWDIQPSWQNSSASLLRARDESVGIGNDSGYAIVHPLTGDLPQLAVRPEARRQGIGRQLLSQARAIAGKPLRIINIDDRSATIASFLQQCGATRTIRQLEMSRQL